MSTDDLERVQRAYRAAKAVVRGHDSLEADLEVVTRWADGGTVGAVDAVRQDLIRKAERGAVEHRAKHWAVIYACHCVAATQRARDARAAIENGDGTQVDVTRAQARIADAQIDLADAWAALVEDIERGER